MSREIAPGLHWIQECGPDRRHFVADSLDEGRADWYERGRALHIPQNAYLFAGEETLLFDTLSPASTDSILEELAAILDGDDLDYVVVSHPDVPHAGNAFPILREYPEATLVAPRYGTGHELYRLDDARLVGEGDAIDLGSHAVTFHEGTFPDAAVHVWMAEEETDSLFPVDWLGFPHVDGECLRFVDEYEGKLTVDRLVEYHGRVLFWLQYVDVAKVDAEIDRLVETFDPSIVAPAHGNVIREDAPEHMRLVKRAVERIDDRGRVGALG